MTDPTSNVQRLDVHSLDNARKAIARGLSRLNIRRRSIRLDFWRGSLVAEETATIVEPHNDRH